MKKQCNQGRRQDQTECNEKLAAYSIIILALGVLLAIIL
jgi:hypothetical protein